MLLRTSLAALPWALLTTLAPASLQAQPAEVPPPPRLSEAQPGTAAPAASAAKATPAASAPAPRNARNGPPPPNVRVIEDDDVRIEEVRGLRGELQRITVYSKTTGLKAYEVIVSPAGGRDPSIARGATGQRGWSLFDF